MAYELLFAQGLLFTIAIEISAALFVRKLLSLPIPWSRFLPGIVLASVLTLPYVWFIFPLIQPKWLFITVAELFAWVMESVWYRYCWSIPMRQALLISLFLNLSSALLGLLIFKA